MFVSLCLSLNVCACVPGIVSGWIGFRSARMSPSSSSRAQGILESRGDSYCFVWGGIRRVSWVTMVS